MSSGVNNHVMMVTRDDDGFLTEFDLTNLSSFGNLPPFLRAAAAQSGPLATKLTVSAFSAEMHHFISSFSSHYCNLSSRFPTGGQLF